MTNCNTTYLLESHSRHFTNGCILFIHSVFLQCQLVVCHEIFIKEVCLSSKNTDEDVLRARILMLLF